MDIIDFAIEYVVGQGGLITDEDDQEIQKLAAELRKHLVPIEQVATLEAENAKMLQYLADSGKSIEHYQVENARLRELPDLHLKTLDQLSAAVKDLRQADEEIERLREAHQELFRLARDVANHVRETSWNIGAIRRLTRYVDSQP